ncbi:MAG: tetratricopeptide repeat protein [Alistipes sp.]|jgi:Flp pilus assembly protein TadD/outer membrane protein OmpA-like peptidoglycan-associated protein|nr:tetratricopeptide repeat protein [Alistipes sp.]
MKKIVTYGIMLSACALVLSSCNCFKKMAKNQDEISIVANPEILTLVGGEIVTDVTVNFPAEYYNPKAIVKVTPVLTFEGGAIEGTPKYFQGEKVNDNYTVISKDNGGSFSMHVSFAWDERARKSTLEMRVEGKCKEGDDFQLAGMFPIAEGVNTLQQELCYAGPMTSLADAFKRVTHDSRSVDILYQVNQSNVRSGELSKEQTELFEEFVRENENKDRVTLGNIEARGYASPDGPEGLNDRLSQKRSETGKAAIAKNLKGLDVNYDVAAYGEDWDGFKSLVEGSGIEDKNLILQVLNMYSSAAQRDTEIKNMSQVYDELKKSVLPELRRTQMVANIDIQGKTDEELIAAAKEDVASLNLEETMFAATLFECPIEKARIYNSAAERFNDARAWNNLGVAYAAQGEWAKAQNSFKKATELSSDPAMANNLALVALAQGDLETAKQYLSSASEATKALAQVHNGDYTAATANLTGYNKAVAEVLAGNLTAAKNALTGLECGNSEYLRAVIAVKEGNDEAAANYLRSAIEKDASLKERAENDVHFSGISL